MELNDFLYIISGTLFISLMAQVTFPLPMIPITGQSLAVLMVALGLGMKHGGLAIALYLLIGILGLPVFAEGTFGWEKIVGKSGGYLYGFLVAGILVGLLGDWGWNLSWWKSILATALGTAIILAIGVGHLSQAIGFEKAMTYGFYPFINGAIVKIFLGALLVWLFYYFKMPLLK